MNSLVSCKHCHILLKNVFVYICDHFHMIWLQKCEIITYRNQSVIPFRVGRRKKKKKKFPALPLDTFGIILHRVSHLIEGQIKRSKVSLPLSLSVLLNLNLIPHYTRFVLLCVCVQILECLNLCVDCQVYFIYSLCLHFRSPKKRSEAHHCKISYLVVTIYHIVL